jgi:glycosyltransferase involved in cell wall biosynthesis
LKELSLNCSINSLGYGTIGRNLIPELKKLNIKVNLFPIGDISVENAEEKDVINWALSNTQFSNLSCPLVKVWHQNEMLSEFGSGEKYGFAIFELDRFNKIELESLSKVKVINCSKWAEEVCKANGIKSHGVVPLGYNPKTFYSKPIPSLDTFKILTMGKWEIRKGHYELPDLLIRAIEQQRIDNPHHPNLFELSICCYNPFYTTAENKSWEDYYKYKLSPYCKLNFIERLKTQEDVRDLILANHISFLPSHSEGWGLEALETLACGRHLVTTKYAGATEYFGKYNFDIELELAIDGKWFFGQGNWLKFTDKVKDDLVDQLLFSFENCYEENKDGLKIAEKFTWKESARKLCKIIGLTTNE